MRRILILAIGGALVLSACASTDGNAEEELPMNEDLPVASEQTQSSDEPLPVEPNEGIGDGTSGEDLPVVSPELGPEIEMAVVDVRQRIGDDSIIEVALAFQLTWPNGALGCPEDGVAYTEALVPGYLIELSHDGTTYVYHGADGAEPFLCAEGPVGSPEVQLDPSVVLVPEEQPPLKESEPTQDRGGPGGEPDE